MAGFPPKKNTAFTFHTALISQADANIIKTSPTLAAGDITVSIDGGNYANIGTLPTQIQTTGVLPVALTAGEMNGNVISVLFHDAAGSEWQDQLVMILTDTHQISGVALVDDAITAAKFDESTAFPIKADDSGSTYIARTGADSDTLEVLSDEIDAVSAQISAIGSGTGAALNFAVNADNASAPLNGVTKIGTETGTYTNTLANDGSVHSLASALDGGTQKILWVYGFSVGAGRSATKVVIRAAMGSTGDTVTFKLYNFLTSTWDTRTTITGTASQLIEVTALAGHTGTSANAGKVYLQIVFDEGDAGVINVNEVYCQAQNLGQTIGYQDGLIWVDTAGSNANTTPFVDGTADNPVNSIAAAYTLAAATGLKGIRFLAGSSVTLTQSAAKWRFVGAATIALNGQSIADAVFRDSYTISGTSTGDDAEFINCGIGTSTIAHAYFIGCRFKGTLTLVAANEYFIMGGYDAVSSGATTFVFAAAAELMVRDWHGGLQLNGMATGDTAIIDGAGRVVIDGSCSGGAITIRGNFAEATGAAAFLLAGGTITDTARWAEDQTMTWNASWDAEVQSEATDALNAYDPPTATEMTNAFTEIKGATWSATTDTLEKLENAITAVDDYVDSEIGTLTTELAKVPKSDSNVTWNATALASMQAEATDALNAYDPPTATEMTNAFTEIKGATWSATTDTLEHIRNKETDIETKVDDTYDDVGDVKTVVDYILVDTGTTLDTKINTIDDYLDTEVAAIKAKTDNLPTDPADQSAVEAAITAATSPLATAAAVAALNNLSAAQVNAEVVDALTVDVIADSVATDGSRPTIAQALLMINRFLMERSVSSTTVTVKKEDGTTSSMTFTINDANTPTQITRTT